MFDLPPELQREIYSFDSTYRLKYNTLMKELELMHTVTTFFKLHLGLLLVSETLQLAVKRFFTKKFLYIILLNRKVKYKKYENKSKLLKRVMYSYLYDTLSSRRPYVH